MKFAWLGCFLLSSLLAAGTQDSEANVNSRYTVESVTVSGDGWTTNLVSDHEDQRISSGLRRQMAELIGNKLSLAALDDLAGKLCKEFHARTVTHRVLRGAFPESVQVVFEIAVRPTHFDVSVPKFLYNAEQGWDGAVEGTATVHHNGFTFGLMSDGDELAERYTGLVARYENTEVGSERVHFRFEFASYHELWNSATRNADAAETDTSGLYRSRENFEPVVTVVLAKPLTLSVGAGFQRFQDEQGGAPIETANAVITSLRYQRRWDDSDYQQDLDAEYNLRAATHLLSSDFIYGRHHWDLRYALRHGKHSVTDDVMAGMITGNAPLYERLYLGNSTTLRGWNKYEIDPVGGNRMVHNSVDYRYGIFEVFYDAGAVWENGQPAVVRHSIGAGLRQGPMFVDVAFPVREGHIDPIFMVGMNY